MDDNIWRFAQFIMWMIGIQTTLLLAAIGFVWKNLSSRIDKLDEKINSMDKRLVAVETMMHMKECCILKENSNRKVE